MDPAVQNVAAALKEGIETTVRVLLARQEANNRKIQMILRQIDRELHMQDGE